MLQGDLCVFVRYRVIFNGRHNGALPRGRVTGVMQPTAAGAVAITSAACAAERGPQCQDPPSGILGLLRC